MDCWVLWTQFGNMTRLGLAFCCLWIVYVHAAPGYGGRDSNHGGDSSSTDAEKRRLTSVALPISQINDEGKAQPGYGAGNDRDKRANGERVSHGDHSSVKESSDSSGRNDSGGRGDANNHSSSGNDKDGIKVVQSGAGNEKIKHESGSGYQRSTGGTNGGDTINFSGNGKNDNDRIGGAGGKNSGDNGGYVGDSAVIGNGSGGKGDTDGLKLSSEKSIKEEQGSRGSVLNVETENNKSDPDITHGSGNGVSNSYHGGTSDEKNKQQGSVKDGLVDDARYSEVSKEGKDAGDKKDQTSSSHSSENDSGSYHSGTGSGKCEQQGSSNEELDQSSSSADSKDLGDKKDHTSGNHGSEKHAGDYNGSTGNEKGQHEDSSGNDKVHTGKNKDQSGKAEDNNGNTGGIAEGKQNLANNYGGGTHNGGGHDGHNNGSHADKSEGHNTNKPRLEDYKIVSDKKGGYGG